MDINDQESYDSGTSEDDHPLVTAYIAKEVSAYGEYAHYLLKNEFPDDLSPEALQRFHNFQKDICIERIVNSPSVLTIGHGVVRPQFLIFLVSIQSA
jgi:hypothetical protein